MPNKKQLPGVVIFAILTTITTLFWVAFDVYRAFTKKPSPSVPTEVLEVLDPTLDPDILAQASGRVYLEDSEIGQTTITLPPVPTETPIPETEEIEETEEETEEDVDQTEETNEQ